ncbi:glycosyltransferase [Homoserinimonas sp. OAct 916]|uniref:glycosyltransferase n=1 Tax=Homoserinimonas sp. OAct 916 TaxID=2211450 RepID=UPI000DBE7293|nr:glycosyltransferase [Homoserinimonas sp. OAct 916]
MIGYYVHHHGTGHLHRAIAIASELETTITGISSLRRPATWAGPWLELPRDDDGSEMFVDVDGGGRLHWAPEYHDGLRKRMAKISTWIDEADPDLMIVDVSVEVALLARLHGVPVVTIVLPGEREDPAHELVHSISRRIIAAWPPSVSGMVRGLDERSSRLAWVGGVSRFDHRDTVEKPPTDGPRRVVMLTGSGGLDVTADQLAIARRQTPGWEWIILGEAGIWADDPWDWLTSAHVVVTHAGQNAIAEVAAARRPAVVLPQSRPFREQEVTAAAIAAYGQYPVKVFDSFPSQGWSDVLDSVARLDGTTWEAWNDCAGIERAVAVIKAELRLTADTVLP